MTTTPSSATRRSNRARCPRTGRSSRAAARAASERSAVGFTRANARLRRVLRGSSPTFRSRQHFARTLGDGPRAAVVVGEDDERVAEAGEDPELRFVSRFAAALADDPVLRVTAAWAAGLSRMKACRFLRLQRGRRDRLGDARRPDRLLPRRRCREGVRKLRAVRGRRSAAFRRGRLLGRAPDRAPSRRGRLVSVTRATLCNTCYSQ
jgi:hypothetical protein